LSKIEIAVRLSGAFPINRSKDRLSSKLVSTLLDETKLYGKPFKLTATHSALSTWTIMLAFWPKQLRELQRIFAREQAASRSQGCAKFGTSRSESIEPD
jgi:hypothetical protein